MPLPLRRAFLPFLLAFFLLPSLAHAAGVAPTFGLSSPSASPFPSDRWTTPDANQLTGLRVDLPKPSCAVFPSDCLDVDVLNSLDGFNVQPRLSIPFTGAIDPASATSASVFLVRLPDGAVTGINQIVWHPATNTLHAESDQLLAQHTRYLLVVTDSVRDAAGDRIEAASFRRELNFGQTKSAADKRYRKDLLDSFRLLPDGVTPGDVAAASLFTTQSVTAELEQIRRQIDASTPAPASFTLGAAGERTVFPRATTSSILLARQNSTAGPSPAAPVAAFPLLHFIPSIGTLAFGAFDSPDYQTAAKVLPAAGTRTGTPAVQGTNRLYFNLFLPAGQKPADGWPVAITGHGFTDSKQGAPLAVAAVLAQAGIASVSINVVGHGGGPLGTLTVNGAHGSVTFPAGGRGIDQNGNGSIDSTEGVDAAPPFTIVANRDGLRQTTVDLMQLVRQIEVGVDADDDGARDLDPGRISYAGQSFGGIYGVPFLAVEPAVRTGVPNVPGGPIIEIARLSPSFRVLVWLNLLSRSPQLVNAPNAAGFFDENLPLRNEPPRIDTVPGAAAIQELIERTEWVSQSANPAAYAPHLMRSPLAGVPAKSVILQFARGDKTVPNPTTSAIIRAGGLEGRTTLFRNDLAHPATPGLSSNPHTFLTGIGGPGTSIAIAAQTQIATFFATGGLMTIDPDGTGPFFETPMVGLPPEDLAYLP